MGKDWQTLVAEQRDRVVAAAHLLRYAADERVGTAYRGIGEIHWLLFWPEGPATSNPYWSDASEAADALIAACIRQFAEWGVTSLGAGGELPVAGVYERLARHGGWADVGNLHIFEPYQRRGVATWLLAHAAEWLRLAQVDRLLDYAWVDPGHDETGQDYAGYREFLAAAGFTVLTQTRRGWTRDL